MKEKQQCSYIPFPKNVPEGEASNFTQIKFFNMFLIIAVWLVSLSVISSQQVNFVVFNTADGIANASDCTPFSETNIRCNLRSAWEACSNLFAGNSCHIELPPAANISFAYNPLVLTNQHVYLLGNNATIQPLDAFKPQRMIDAVLVNASNTDSGYQNTFERCMEACPNDIFTFSAVCNAERVGDAVVRLYLQDEEITSLEVFCDFIPYSQIEYTYLGPNCTTSLCLRVGCSEDSACVTSAIIQRDTLPTNDASAFQFITYQADSLQGRNDSVVPQLSISNLTLAGFGGPQADGGAIHLDGPLVGSFRNVKFYQNTGRYGAAVFVANNEAGVEFTDNQFVECLSYGGGALSLFERNVNVNLSHNAFLDCQAFESSAGLHIGSDNTLITVKESVFSHCTARDNGSAVLVDSDNTHVTFSGIIIEKCVSDGGAVSIGDYNSYVLVQDAVFVSNVARVDGGCIHVHSHNDFVIIADSSFSSCFALGNGGAVSVHSHNTHLTITNTAFDMGFADTGGCVYLANHNHNVTVAGSSFLGCLAISSGGGLYANSSNTGIALENSVFGSCFALYAGGGVRVGEYNTISLAGLKFENCEANQGGGLNVLSHSTVTLHHSQLHFCTAYSTGGGVYVGDSNDITVHSTLIADCTAFNGGGLFVKSRNENISVSGVTFQNCQAHNAGGGMLLSTNNLFLQMVDSVLEACEASQGAGLFLDSDNNHAYIEHTIFALGSASSGGGGGIYVKDSTHLTLRHVDLFNNSALLSGGALYLGDNVHTVTLTECTFLHNSAEEYGGAIFSVDTSSSLTIAGCHLGGNVAGESGGGLAIEGGNRNLVITDSAGAAQSFVLESAHPYECIPGEHIVYTTNSSNAAGIRGFLIQFDPRTKLGVSDYISIFTRDDASEEFYPFFAFHNGGSVPGFGDDTQWFLRSLKVMLHCEGAGEGGGGGAESNLFGFKIYVTAVTRPDSSALGNSSSTPTTFSNNHAGGRGGAVYLAASVEYAAVANTQFLHNTADAGGGAVYLRNAITGFTMMYCGLLENEANGDGGALLVSTVTNGLLLSECEFSRNSAQGNGGAISLVSNNGNDGRLFADYAGQWYKNDEQLRVSKCLFTHNIADYGGAIHVDKENDIMLLHCTLQSNNAGMAGGGLAAATRNHVVLYMCTFAANAAGESGGAVASLMSNTLFVLNSTFDRNFAGLSGGGIYLANETEATVWSSVTLRGNVAGYVGGAIATVFSPLWVLQDDDNLGTASIQLSGNTARRGSALYFRGLHKPATDSVYHLHSHRFEGNVATVGGTVYWLYDRSMFKNPFAQDNLEVTSSAIWSDNVAPYGERFATQAMQIQGPREYTAVVYGTALSPPLPFYLYDYYGQRIAMNGPTSAVVSIVSPNSNQCKNRFPFLTGAGAEELVLGGLVTFDELVVQCAPEGAITLNFEARLLDLKEITDSSLTSYFISNRTEMSFRSCKAGEFIKDGQCVTCPIGSYSLEATVTESTACRECTTQRGVSTCYADQLITKVEYWRRYPSSVALLQCGNDLSACRGGNGTGDGLCVEGHEGPLCAVCSDGYFKDGQVCSRCEDNRGNIRPVTALYLAIAGCIVAACAFFFYSNCLDITGQQNPDEAVVPDNAQSAADSPQTNGDISAAEAGTGSKEVPPPSWNARTKVWLQKKFKTLKSQLKIIVATYQILASIPETADVKFPAAFSRFLGAIDVFNLDIVSTVPLECGVSHTFIDKLIFTTLFPIALSLLLLLSFVCEVAVQIRTPFKLSGDARKTKLLTSLKDKYLTYFFFLTYFVLPSVATMIFQTFLCTNVDPSGEDDASDDYFLTADMSISCTSDYYYRGVAYAAVMLLLYVVGIPALYLIMLYYNREELMTRDDVPHTFDAGTQTEVEGSAVDDEQDSPKPVVAPATPQPKVLSARAARLSFLWDAYEPQFWYWEVVETTRRLMLTAVLSVCGAGTSPQAIFAILLALMYIKLYGYYKPYVEDKDDFLAETGQFQIFLSFLGALIYQRSLLGSKWNSAVSITLILANLAISVIFTYYEVAGLVEQIQEYRRDRADDAGTVEKAENDEGPEKKIVRRPIYVSMLDPLKAIGVFGANASRIAIAEDELVGVDARGGGGEAIALESE